MCNFIPTLLLPICICTAFESMCSFIDLSIDPAACSVYSTKSSTRVSYPLANRGVVSLHDRILTPYAPVLRY